ncbi:formimidoyltetrahydrofolate cyclodeaminase [Halobacteriales archaeon QH_7_66_37]|nr:MAG: formimidoyltetrahydrofolate cyclodeaminase [Halobacteriales archaeon QH_7_66_37]
MHPLPTDGVLDHERPDMTSYRTQPIEKFLSGIASRRVTPAGGSASAVSGAIGASLCEMVCLHTVEKAGDDAVSQELVEAGETLRTQRDGLLTLADADAAVVDGLFGANGDQRDEQQLKRAIGIPLTIARACLTVVESAEVVANISTRTALADAATGVMLARAALQASLFTARSNLDAVPDQSFVDGIGRRTTGIERTAEENAERVLQTINRRLADA